MQTLKCTWAKALTTLWQAGITQRYKKSAVMLRHSKHTREGLNVFYYETILCVHIAVQ